MRIARIENDTVILPLLLEAEFRALFPLTGFPKDLTDDVMPKGYALVHDTEPPATNRWQTLTEALPAPKNGVWARQWVVEALPLTTADKVAQVKQDIDATARYKRDTLAVGVSTVEMASWSRKAAEAATFLASGKAEDAPTLAIEAKARGIALDALAAKVDGNAADLRAAEAAISGWAGALRDAATAAGALKTESKAEAALLAIDVTAGWPV